MAGKIADCKHRYPRHPSIPTNKKGHRAYKGMLLLFQEEFSVITVSEDHSLVATAVLQVRGRFGDYKPEPLKLPFSAGLR